MLCSEQSQENHGDSTPLLASGVDQQRERADKLLARAKAISDQNVERVKQLGRFQQIIVTVIDAWQREKRYVFEQRQLCLVGRARDCDIRLPGDFRHGRISHYHCALEIDPPFVSVRDLGSTNGTYVNGWKVGKRRSDINLGRTHFSGMMLLKGDEVRLGPVTLRIGIEEDPGEIDLLGTDFRIESQITGR